MTRSKVDLAWNVLSLAVTEILNPLLLISVALFVSVGYILYLLMPLTIDFWAALLLISIALPLAFLTGRARRLWRERQGEAVRFSWRCFLPILPVLVLLPPAIAVLLLPSIYTIAHMDLQFPFIIQVVHGASPYESVIAPGNPSNQYWLYYVFIAAVIRVSSLDIFSAWILVNMAFFFSCPLWIGRTLLSLNLAKNQTLRLGLLILFCFAAMNLTGIQALSAHPLDGTAEARARGIGGIVASARGLTSSITAFTAIVYVVVNLLQDRFDRSSFVLASAAGIVSLTFMPIIALYTFVSVLGALVLIALYSLATSPQARQKTATAYIRKIAARIGPGFLVLWVLVSLALALPILKYILDFTTGLRSSIGIFLPPEENIHRLIRSSLLLLPPAALQFVYALRSKSMTQLFLAFCAVIGLALALTVDSTADDATSDQQGKFHSLLPVSLAFLALLLVQNRRSGRRIISSLLKAYVYALVFLALLNAAHYSYRYSIRKLSGPSEARFEGIRVYTTEVFGGRVSALYWIHDHTPHDAIILIPHVYTVRSKLFHGRLNYVSKGGKIYADYLPGYDQRKEDLHTFYNPETTIEEYLELLASMQTQLPGRAFYAVVMDPELSREIMAQRGAQLVFEKPTYGAHVYLLNPPAAS